MVKQQTSPDSPDFIYDGGQIEAVVVYGRSRYNEWLRQISGAQYYHNNALFREAMAYMRRAKDVDGERIIFMKRLEYGRAQWAKGVFGIIGGVVAVGIGVGALASSGAAVLGSRVLAIGGRALSTGKTVYSGAINFVNKASVRAYLALPKVDAFVVNMAQTFWRTYKATTGARMIANAATQAGLDEEGLKGIDIISVASEVIPGGHSTWTKVAGIMATGVTPIFEWKPFSERYKDTNGFRAPWLGNKTQSEVVFDMGWTVTFGSILHYSPVGVDIITNSTIQTGNVVIKKELGIEDGK